MTTKVSDLRSLCDRGQHDHWNPFSGALHQGHVEAYEELMEKYTREELVAFAKALPFDSNAANAILRGYSTKYKPDLDKWLDAILAEKSPIPRKHCQVAAYCAAASQNAIAKVLGEMVELAKAKLEKLNQINLVLETAKKSQVLLDLMKGKKK
jgi:hypothetical protein